MSNRVVKISRMLFLCSILLICLTFCLSVSGSNGWPSSERFTIMGLNVHVYFSPESGKVASELEEVSVVLNITRENNDYILLIIMSSYGTIQGNESIDSNIGGHNIIINTTINSYAEEFSLKTPDNGSFTSFMVIDFFWGDLDSQLYNKTVNLAAEYQKYNTGLDLALIMIPGGGVVLLFGMLIVANYYLKNYRTRDIDLTEINEKLLHVNTLPRKFLTRGGEFKELDLSKVAKIPRPGEITQLEHRKRRMQDKFEKLKPRLDELEEITYKLEEARKPVINNDLFKFISSYFIRASRKRENYPLEEDVVYKVQQLRDSLQDGKWDQLKNINNLKLGWSICNKYVNSSNISKDPPLNVDFILEKETKTLVDNIKNFDEVKKNAKWPPDANLIIQSKEDILAELKIIDRLLKNFKSMGKKDLKNYIKNCTNLKKEVNKHLKWLKSVVDIIDGSEGKRLEIRLRKIKELLVEELKAVA